MKIRANSVPRLALAAIALALMAGGASADKPSWAGGGKHNPAGERTEEWDAGRRDQGDGKRGGTVSISFGNEDRRIVSDYYGNQARKGKCPPGLAKKDNGCQPPGQAKKWNRGQPLAKDVKYYELPKELRVRLPAPPPDHRYVRIAGDVLLIAVGTGIVVDAIEDILR